MTLHATSACVGGRHAPAQADGSAVQKLSIAAKPQHPAVAWGLSARERQAVELYIVHGLGKLVAVEMGVTPKTVEIYLCHAKAKSGFSRLVPMAIAYDRAARCLDEAGV